MTKVFSSPEHLMVVLMDAGAPRSEAKKVASHCFPSEKDSDWSNLAVRKRFQEMLFRYNSTAKALFTVPLFSEDVNDVPAGRAEERR